MANPNYSPMVTLGILLLTMAQTRIVQFTVTPPKDGRVRSQSKIAITSWENTDLHCQNVCGPTCSAGTKSTQLDIFDYGTDEYIWFNLPIALRFCSRNSMVQGQLNATKLGDAWNPTNMMMTWVWWMAPIYIYIYVYIDIHTYVYVYVYVCVCMCVYIYICG